MPGMKSQSMSPTKSYYTYNQSMAPITISILQHTSLLSELYHLTKSISDQPELQDKYQIIFS